MKSGVLRSGSIRIADKCSNALILALGWWRTIQSVVDQTNQTFSSQTDANGEPPEVARQLSLLAEGRQRAIEELDEAQRQHWQEWIGQPFDWSRLGE